MSELLWEHMAMVVMDYEAKTEGGKYEIHDDPFGPLIVVWRPTVGPYKELWRTSRLKHAMAYAQEHADKLAAVTV